MARLSTGLPPAAISPPPSPLAERRALRARYRCQGRTHSHFTHTPSASPIALSTLTTTPHRASPPPPYLPPPPSNPRVFLVRGFSSLGGGRSAHPPNSKPYIISPTNLSDSPPAELDACSPPPRAQDTPSEPPRWAVPSPPPAAQPRCWDRPDASLDVGTGVPPRCCRQGGRGLPDPTTALSISEPVSRYL